MPLPPKDKTIIPPTDGWKEHTYYWVRVSYRPSNPIHSAILGVGFLGANSEPGQPGNYSEVWCNTYDRAELYSKVHYLEVIRELDTSDQ